MLSRVSPAPDSRKSQSKASLKEVGGSPEDLRKASSAFSESFTSIDFHENEKLLFPSPKLLRRPSPCTQVAAATGGGVARGPPVPAKVAVSVPALTASRARRPRKLLGPCNVPRGRDPKPEAPPQPLAWGPCQAGTEPERHHARGGHVQGAVTPSPQGSDGQFRRGRCKTSWLLSPTRTRAKSMQRLRSWRSGFPSVAAWIGSNLKHIQPKPEVALSQDA